MSPSCERNKDPILEVMKEVITEDNHVLLEVGSGTGQHAVYLAPHFPHVKWITSDVLGNHAGIKMWLDEAKVPNIARPIEFKIGKDEFPKVVVDLVFTANTFHIMHWKECKTLMKMWGHRLREGAQVMIYGPFNYNGTFSSPSNEQFDRSLKVEDPLRGIRSYDDVHNNMVKNGFALCKDYEMPANNRMLVYRRLEFVSQK